MRVVVAVAAGLLWVSTAHAQTPDASSPEPTLSQAQTPATGTSSSSDATTTQAASQMTDRDHEIVCHTTMGTGSRLSSHGHGTRICKTRTQWELEQQDLQRRMGNANAVVQPDPMQQRGNN